MRTFTIYPERGAERSFAIRATYPEPGRKRRYGALQVCSGWTLDRILDRFRSVGRSDAVTRLAKELAAGLAVTVDMGRQDLILWNHA